MQVPEEELVVPSNLERYGLSEASAGIPNYRCDGVLMDTKKLDTEKDVDDAVFKMGLGEDVKTSVVTAFLIVILLLNVIAVDSWRAWW